MSLDSQKKNNLPDTNGTRYRVRVASTVSEEFDVLAGLKQGDEIDRNRNR